MKFNLQELLNHNLHIGNTLNLIQPHTLKFIYCFFKTYTILDIIYIIKSLLFLYKYTFILFKLNKKLIYIHDLKNTSKIYLLFLYTTYITLNYLYTYIYINNYNKQIKYILWFLLFNNLNYKFKLKYTNLMSFLFNFIENKTIFIYCNNYKHKLNWFKFSKINKKLIISIINSNLFFKYIDIPIYANNTSYLSILYIQKIIITSFFNSKFY